MSNRESESRIYSVEDPKTPAEIDEKKTATEQAFRWQDEADQGKYEKSQALNRANRAQERASREARDKEEADRIRKSIS